MGIRFYCPNGHRLHVKSFLAGKRGICPHCEIGFRIPAESNIPRGSPKVLPGSLAAHGGKSKCVSASTAIATTRTEAPLELAVKTTAARMNDPIGDVLGVEVAVKSKALPAKPDPTQLDPISEAPEAVWYVRPPAGGQFGPAKGDVMRKWIAEGRVSHDSLVWREGWPEWQLAGPLFPSLNPSYTAPASMVREPVSLKLQSVSAEATGGQAVARTIPKPKSMAAVIVLSLMVVALLAVFVVVILAK